MKGAPKPRVQPRNQRVSSRKQRKQQHLLDVKVRSRAANRQRNRRVLACLSGMFLFCAAIGGVCYGSREALRRFFWQNPDYNLAEVAIHTDGSLTREQIVQATGIHEGSNIFAINLSTARKALMALPQVQRAEIERILPNKLSIDISERKPVAWVTRTDDADPSADAGAFLIDADGILLRIKNQVREYYHLPVICGLDVDNYEEGSAIDLPEMRAALELIQLTGENPARYQVRSIDISKGYCLVVTDERHAKVTFPLDDIAAQLDRLQVLYDNIDGSRREIQTVNLLVRRNVPVTFAPDPDTTTDGAEPGPSPSAAAAEPVASPSPVPKKISPAKKSATKHTLRKSSTYYHHEMTVRRAIPVFTPAAEQ
jgi:cell division protein FtsQ